jgi:hypothetical protein
MAHRAGRPCAGSSGGDTPAGQRGIGPIGSSARVVVGAALLADVIAGHAHGGWRVAPWLLGVVVFPATLLVWQAGRARRGAPRLMATGPLAHAANIGVFVTLYFAGELVPVLDPTSDAALIFYGASMLVAAVRGYPGCEVLAVSNWLLRRDDQVGCAVFFPIDALEAGDRLDGAPGRGDRRRPRGPARPRTSPRQPG